MTPGNVEFVQVLCSMTIETGGVAALLYADRHVLRSRRRARRWLPATEEAAVLGAFLFGPLYGGPALVIHFAKSRGALGFVIGLVAAGAVVTLDVCMQLGAAATIDRLGL
ncbi:MAG: hypothetical protein ABSE49_25325 [Polyangiaceae bacterium]